MLYDIIRDAHRDADEAIIALGLAFGQLIADAADFEWLRVQDEYGEETALARRGFAAYCHPISMMQKRIEHGQQEDLSELRDTTIRIIQDRVENGILGQALRIIAGSDTMIAVIGSMRFPAETIADLLPHVQALVRETNAHDGCIAYDVGRDVLDPGLLRFSEVWPDQASLDRHIAAPHIAPWRQACQDHGILDRNFAVYDIGEARSL